MSAPPVGALRRAAVLGSGVMGAQIAAQLANQGVEVELLDVAAGPGEPPDAVARRGLGRLREMSPAPLFGPECAARIRPGSLDHDLGRLAGVDWVIEAIVEQLEPKRALWARAAAAAGPQALLSTNTSGLSVAAIAQALPAEARARFVGVHLFNPPRYLHLVEVVPQPEAAPAYVERAAVWASRDLGKGVVVCRDTPNFIANRVGVFGMLETLRAMTDLGLRPEEVDAATGEAIGHPASATFRTLDVVGLDVAVQVADNLVGRLADPAEREAFAVPALLRRLVARGSLGRKTDAGLYRRIPGASGRAAWEVVDPDTLDYRPQAVRPAPALQAARREERLAVRLGAIAFADEPAGRLVWRVLSRTALYAAACADEMAAGDLDLIDRAMRWGYGWQLGPFEALRALGADRVRERLAAEGATIPGRLDAWLDAGAAGGAMPAGGRGAVVWTAPSATLRDVGDEVALLELHPDKAAIGPDLIATLHRAAREVATGWRGLVLVAPGPERFLVGANLALVLMAAQDGNFDLIGDQVEALQSVYLELKYLPRPVVAAPLGLTLGGGAELVLHADGIVTGDELYVGQVEVGAGLIPAGGGTKELLLRALAPLAPDLAWNPALAAGAAPAAVGSALFADPAPFVARLFQTIALARVSRSATEARRLGFLGPADEVVRNVDDLVGRARARVVALAAAGYRPPARLRLAAPGREVRALLDVAVDGMVRSRLASGHDARIARALAHVLTGGDVAMGTERTEADWLALEREAFLSLCGEAKSQARMEHILRTGRPLRN